MSTRAMIIIPEAGVWKSIYLHSDGDISQAGLMLFNHYDGTSDYYDTKRSCLIELGDCAALGAGLAHTDWGGSKFFGRDNGETGTNAVEHTSLEDALDYASEPDFEYVYVYNNFGYDGPYGWWAAEGVARGAYIDPPLRPRDLVPLHDWLHTNGFIATDVRDRISPFRPANYETAAKSLIAGVTVTVTVDNATIDGEPEAYDTKPSSYAGNPAYGFF